MCAQVQRVLQVAVAAVLVALAVCAWPMVGERGSVESRADAWAAANANKLPVQLTAIAQYPDEYRAAIFAAHRPSNRLRLWKEHLDNAATDPRLSEDQQGFLRRLSRTLSIEDFAVDGTEREELSAVVRQADTVLESYVDHIFSAPGGGWSVSTSLRHPMDGLIGFRLRVGEQLRDWLTVAAQANPAPYCSCAVEEQGKYDCATKSGYTKWCNPNDPEAKLCRPVEPGGASGGLSLCGLLRNRKCNGYCYWSPITSGGGSGSCPYVPDCGEGMVWSSTFCTCTRSPILVDVNGDGFALTNVEDGVLFDINATGTPIRIAWTRPDGDDGWLVWDRDGNGRIDDGRELFGSASVLPNGGIAANGFEALAAFDDDGDSTIDQSDQLYFMLRLWVDADHNGVSTAEELLTLEAAGLVRIETVAKESRRQDANGNQFLMRAKGWWLQGSTLRPRDIYDVWLAVEPGSQP